MKLALGAIVKDEENDIVEWVLFHLLTEFDTVIVYDNGSTDKTKERLLELQSDFDVRVNDWPHIISQVGAYNDIIDRFKHEFDWLAFLDSDEFLVSSEGAGHVRQRLGELTDADAVAVNWLCFGSSGFIDSRERLVTPTFMRRGLTQQSTNRHIKTIVRSHAVIKAVNPHYFNIIDRKKYKTVLGEDAVWSKPGKFLCAIGTDIIRINHYYTRSKIHYDIKIDRGRADSLNKRVYEFAKHDRNEVFDDLMKVKYTDVISKISAISKKKLIWEDTMKDIKND